MYTITPSATSFVRNQKVSTSFKKTSSPSVFNMYCNQFKQAIQDEITALRKAGGQTVIITDGRRLGKRDGKNIYSFSTDTEIRLPDDTSVDIVYQKERYPSNLLSIEGFDLLVSIPQNIGDKISSARMTTEPWFLLEKLQERLDQATIKKSANRQLAEALLSDNPKSVPTNNETFNDFNSRIETQIQKPLIYNDDQADAITHVLQHPISFIWGPPGTGKTSTLGPTVAALTHSGQSVLVLSHSNTAVDTAMKSLTTYLCQSSYYKEGFILRFGVDTLGLYKQYPMINVRGISKQQNPKLIEQILALENDRKKLVQQSRQSGLSHSEKESIKEKISKIRADLQPLKQQLKHKESELVRQAMIVGCTLSKAVIAPEIYERKFDAVIIDEASMAYIPHCFYVATLAARRIAIFGDFRQLGPISQAQTEASETWLQRDVFDEAGIITRVDRNQDDARMVLLQTQYRMHPDISKIPNRLFYGERLQDGEGVESNTLEIVNSNPHPGRSLIFYDLSKASSFCCKETESHSRFNIISALIAAELSYQSLKTQSGNIGIITPYNAQSRLLHRILKETHLDEGYTDRIKVATVHKFQGSEQALIIFDAVDSYPQKKVGKLLEGGRESTAARLSNVAISRAQGKFIGLFDYDFFQKKQDTFHTFRLFLERFRSCSLVTPFRFINSSDSSGFSLPGVDLYENHTSARQAIQRDIQNAIQTIAIDWPVHLNQSQHFQLSVKVHSKINWIIRGPDADNISKLVGNYNTRIWKPTSFGSMGLLGIDEKILWIYPSPNSNSPIFRISLPKTVQLLYSFLQLIPDQPRAADKAFGICEICNSPLWPQQNSYGDLKLICPRHPHQQKNLSESDINKYIQMTGTVCEKCHSTPRGVKSKSNGKWFLACSHTKCDWKCGLNHIV